MQDKYCLTASKENLFMTFNSYLSINDFFNLKKPLFLNFSVASSFIGKIKFFSLFGTKLQGKRMDFE